LVVVEIITRFDRFKACYGGLPIVKTDSLAVTFSRFAEWMLYAAEPCAEAAGSSNVYTAVVGLQP
jgi:hypothetical protein